MTTANEDQAAHAEGRARHRHWFRSMKEGKPLLLWLGAIVGF
jgi:hypothetical protein